MTADRLVCSCTTRVYRAGIQIDQGMRTVRWVVPLLVTVLPLSRGARAPSPFTYLSPMRTAKLPTLSPHGSKVQSHSLVCISMLRTTTR